MTIPTQSTIATLAARLPAGTVSTDPEALATRSHDWWALDLLRATRGEPARSPAAVVLPATTAEVATILQWATETGTGIAPRGGGSGVCGAARPGPDRIVLDTSRMNRIIEVDEISNVVHVQAGVFGDALESALAEHDLTLGHYPQSIELSTVGGWIAAASAGQASAGFGAIEDLLLGLTAVLSSGEILTLKPVPRSAAGPDLRRLMVGSEGAFGVITEAYLSCSPRPAAIEWQAFGFETFEALIEAIRWIVRAGAHPMIVRGYDAADATLAFGRMGHSGGPVALVGFGAGSPGLTERHQAATDAATDAGAKPLPDGYGEHWWEHRNDAVGTYRRVMGEERMFGPGVVVDTMEVAGLWRDVPTLHAAVRAALLDHTEVVGCHVSHPYPAGASLYFTFLLRADDDRAVEAVYLSAWDAAAAACMAAGGTISHHHGVGLLKAPYLAAELGSTGTEVLARLKRAFDPAGVLNAASFDVGGTR